MQILNTTNLLSSFYYCPIFLHMQDGEMSLHNTIMLIAAIIITFILFWIYKKILTGNMWEREEARKSFSIAAIIASVAIIALHTLLE